MQLGQDEGVVETKAALQIQLRIARLCPPALQGLGPGLPTQAHAVGQAINRLTAQAAHGPLATGPFRHGSHPLPQPDVIASHLQILQRLLCLA